MAASSDLIGSHVSATQCKKAIDALHAHVTFKASAAEETELLPGRESNQNVWLQIAVKTMQPQKRIMPVKIPIKHPLVDPRTTPICLLTKDPQREYKDLLETNDIKFISRVVGISKLKGKFKPFEARRMLLKEHGMFLADERIIPLLPTLLGRKWFDAKKQPIPVNLTLKNVKAELERAISSTYMHLNAGTCTSIRIGTQTQSPKHILENLKEALPSVISAIKGGWDNIQSLHVKTNDSVALPVWTCGDRWAGPSPVVEEEKGKGKKRGKADVLEEEEERPKKKSTKEKLDAAAIVEAPSLPSASDSSSKKMSKSKPLETPSSIPEPEPIPKKKSKKDKAITDEVVEEPVVKKSKKVKVIEEVPEPSKKSKKDEPIAASTVELEPSDELPTESIKKAKKDKDKAPASLAPEDSLVILREKPKKEKTPSSQPAHELPVASAQSISLPKTDEKKKKKPRVSFTEPEDDISVEIKSKLVTPSDVKQKRDGEKKKKKEKIIGGGSGKNTTGKSVKDKVLASNIGRRL